MTTNKGTLIRWLDDKGYGFIKPDNGEPDVFIHISALKGMSRKPIIGDVIHYQIGFDKNGKTRAINAKIEGVSSISTLAAFAERPISNPSKRTKSYQSSTSDRNPHKRFGGFPTLIFIAIVFAVAYQESSKRRNDTTPIEAQTIEDNFPEYETPFECQGKVHCSEMTSYEEAYFYLHNCPNTQLDGDGDGIPCEQQF